MIRRHRPLSGPVLALAATLISCAGESTRAESPHWGYDGNQGPGHWSELSADFSNCAGKYQSPVDLRDFVDAPLPALAFDYRPGGRTLRHTGHALQVDYDSGSSLSVEGRVYALRQVHFHAPSENTIEGRAFPLEAHLVHADASGALAVVSVLFAAADRENATLAELAPLPAVAGEQRTLPAILSAAGLLPPERAYYRYEGSLTTPPCTEGVTWLVLKQPLHATRAQLEAIAAASKANHRPVQPLNGRIVLE